MEVNSDDKTLKINGNKICFDYPIKDFKVINNYCIVMLRIPPKSYFNENVFGLDKDGIIWQVEKLQYNHDDSPFVSIFDEDDKVRLQNWDGTQLIVEPSTGKVLDQKWFK